MITLVDLLAFVAFVGFVIVGFAVGHDLAGAVGAVAGIAVGGFAGYFIARKLHLILLRWQFGPSIRELKRLSLEELKGRLEKPIFTLNLTLLELKSRGEDMRQYLPIVVEYLTSEHQPRRTFGLAALLSAYPELGSKIKSYSLRDSVEECRRKTAILLETQSEQSN